MCYHITDSQRRRFPFPEQCLTGTGLTVRESVRCWRVGPSVPFAETHVRNDLSETHKQRQGGIPCLQQKARDFHYETEYETADPYDPGFYDHCGGLFLPDTGYARHRRRLDELYPCGTIFAAVFPLGFFPRPPHYTDAGAALPASDRGADAGVAYFAHAEI